MDNANREFFAAANSGDGFVNFYSDIFYRRGIRRRYLIKGGPGTGKSTFMKKIAQKAAEKGYSIEYYRCSSDPTSLDGIIIGERIALMDATSPHCVDAKIAGAEDEIVDLGAFWDPDALEEDVEKIKLFSEQKNECFSRAYGFLSAAKQIDDVNRKRAYRHIDANKLDLAVKRILERLPHGEFAQIKTGLCDSIGINGGVHLESYEKMAKKLYVIRDYCYCGSLFLEYVFKYAKEMNRLTVSYSPLNTKLLDAIYFDDAKIAFVIERKDVKDYEEVAECVYMNTKRFFKKSIGETRVEKALIKKNRQLADSIILRAKRELKNAGEIHFLLESIYIRRMDFEKQDDFLNRFSENLLKKLV